MNAARPKSGGWSGGRLLTVAAVIFAAQAGLVLLFAERGRPAPAAPASRTVFRLLGAPLDEAGLSKYIFAADPTVFPSSSPHGFADQAWLRLPAVEYNKGTNDTEPPSFLEFAGNRLGARRMAAGPDQEQIPFELVGEPEAWPEAAPSYQAADGSRAESFYQIEGALAGRQTEAPVALREWASSVVLSNTVVQFAVTRSGEVVSARLWAGSGLPEADASAVEAVSGMRFSPAGTSSAELGWDKATFYWRTIEPPPGTNAPGHTAPEAP